ncbi:hypothetical protein Fmac_017849 [Flemingia macrophylla]|uniref:Uncharacterized protein n=1 Tax=Flemingia macrophylla TaxID=520843 RepID=A0ABD1M3C8_9FABA
MTTTFSRDGHRLSGPHLSHHLCPSLSLSLSPPHPHSTTRLNVTHSHRDTTFSSPSPLPSPFPLLTTHTVNRCRDLNVSGVVNCEFRDNRTRELDSWPALPDEVKECSKIVACFLACAGVRYHYDDFCRISYLDVKDTTISTLATEKDGASFLGSNPDQMLGYYPFRNLRVAADLLFLHGGSIWGSPDTTLMVLRWAGCDGGPHMTSLRDVVTAVRVRVECGLMTEAFMHQRVLCTRVKENNFNKRASADTSEKLKGQLSNWVEWVEVPSNLSPPSHLSRKSSSSSSKDARRIWDLLSYPLDSKCGNDLGDEWELVLGFVEESKVVKLRVTKWDSGGLYCKLMCWESNTLTRLEKAEGVLGGIGFKGECKGLHGKDMLLAIIKSSIMEHEDPCTSKEDNELRYENYEQGNIWELLRNVLGRKELRGDDFGRSGTQDMANIVEVCQADPRERPGAPVPGFGAIAPPRQTWRPRVRGCDQRMRGLGAPVTKLAPQRQRIGVVWRPGDRGVLARFAHCVAFWIKAFSIVCIACVEKVTTKRVCNDKEDDTHDADI